MGFSPNLGSFKAKDLNIKLNLIYFRFYKKPILSLLSKGIKITKGVPRLVKKKVQKKEIKNKPKKSYAGLIWGIVAVVAVLVILFFALKGCAKTPTTPTGPTTPTEPTIEPKPVISTTTPNEIRYCEKTTDLVDGKIMIALGYKPCSCNIENGKATLTIMNSGYGDLPAMWFKIVGATGKTVYMFDNNLIKSKDSRAYEFDMNSLKSQVGEEIDDILALPVNGKDTSSICLNQRLIVIKEASCIDRC